MEKDGILFYSNNDAPIPLLAVALFTLRQYYKGAIHVVFGPTTPVFIKNILEKQTDITFSFQRKRYYDEQTGGNKYREWCEKPFIICYESPFENTLYYDCDHAFFLPFDLNIFSEIKSNKLVTSIEKGIPTRLPYILNELNGCGFSYKNDFQKVNGGCVGYQKGYNGMEKWIERMYLFGNKGGRILRRNREEFALASVINDKLGSIVSDRWSKSLIVSRKSVNYLDIPPDDAIAIHYARGRYAASKSWLKSLKITYVNNFLNFQSDFNSYLSCTVNGLLNDLLNKKI